MALPHRRPVPAPTRASTWCNLRLESWLLKPSRQSPARNAAPATPPKPRILAPRHARHSTVAWTAWNRLITSNPINPTLQEQPHHVDKLPFSRSAHLAHQPRGGGVGGHHAGHTRRPARRL